MSRLFLHRLYNISLRNKWLVFASVLIVVLLLSNTAAANEYLNYCGQAVYNRKYRNAGCWSCDLVTILMSGGVGAVNRIYERVLVDFAAQLLNICGAIWIAVFMLKTLGSFAAQDPGKVLDALFNFMFKWAIAFTVIHGGLANIVVWIVQPLLSIGFDIGAELTRLASF